MYGFHLTASVVAGKENELLLSARSILASGGLARSYLYRDVDDPQLSCVEGLSQRKEDLEAFMGTPAFHALIGAAGVLGTLRL